MALGRLIKNAVREIVKWSMSNEKSRDVYETDCPSPVSSGKNASIGSDRGGLNFVVYPATGGRVVQFSSYDPRTDRHNQSLYVIVDGEDLGEELGHIITKESLSR